MLSPRAEFLAGLRDTLPLILAAFPFGLLYGALAATSGLSLWAAQAMSVFVFAGSAQFIAVSLIASATALPVILMTVFVVNLRHVLYATSLMPAVAHLPQRHRVPLAFGLTDETFAVVNHRLSQSEGQCIKHYFWGSMLSMYGFWSLATALGIWLGHSLPDLTQWGLDVAMVVAFVGIVVPALKQHSHWACAITAAGLILLTYDWPYQSGLLVSSMIAVAVGVGLDRHAQKTSRKQP